MLALIVGGTERHTGRTAADPPLIIGGLSLAERAVLAAQRAGIVRSAVVGVSDPGGDMTGRLRARGANVSFVDWRSLQHLDTAGGLLLINEGVLVEPRAVE